MGEVDFDYASLVGYRLKCALACLGWCRGYIGEEAY